MALKYGFFNSVNGDRRYNADDMSNYFEGLVSNGVYENIGDAMVVTAGTGMNVIVGTGRAIIDCKWLRNDSAYNIAITPADTTLARYTSIVILLDKDNRNMSITAIDGEPATTPELPTVPENSLILADILIPANSTSILQANITDDRADSTVCGWVTGLIEQVDTSELFLQWQDAYTRQFETFKQAYDEWFEHLTQELTVDTYVGNYSKRVEYDDQVGNTIELDMTGYVYESSDIITVFINGLKADVNEDYTIDTSGVYPEITTNATASGTVVYISVLKSKIGFNV